MNYRLVVSGLAAASFLTACNTSTPEESTRVLTLSEIAASGTPIDVSNAMSVLARDTTARTTRLDGRKTVTVTPSKNANGDLIVELKALGRTVSFSPSDLISGGTEYKKTLPDGTEVYLWTYDGTWEDIANGSSKFKFMARVATSDVVNGNMNTRAYGVLGSRTLDTQLPTTGTATYAATEGFRADFYAPSGSNSKVKLTGDVRIDMNFANSQLSGEFSNFKVNNGTTPTGSLKINPTTVSNGTFSSNLALVGATNGETLTSSSVNGAFFGDAAQEVGGDMMTCPPKLPSV